MNAELIYTRSSSSLSSSPSRWLLTGGFGFTATIRESKDDKIKYHQKSTKYEIHDI